MLYLSFFLIYVNVSVPLCLYATWFRYWQKPKEGIGSFRAGDSGGYELADMGARNQTLVLWKDNSYMNYLAISLTSKRYL